MFQVGPPGIPPALGYVLVCCIGGAVIAGPDPNALVDDGLAGGAPAGMKPGGKPPTVGGPPNGTPRDVCLRIVGVLDSVGT